MLTSTDVEVMTVRWAFWRRWSTTSSEPQRPLPDDVGLPATDRPPAARGDRDPDDDGWPAPSVARSSGATPSTHPGTRSSPVPAPPLTAPGAAAEIDRTAVAAAGHELASAVSALLAGAPAEPPRTDDRTLAVAATGALAARLPALSGVDGAVAFDEPEDELLHAYADLLVGRAAARRTRTPVDPDDLLAVAHVAAAAAAVGAATEPALLLLAGVPADHQVQAAALLLAQTADDGGAAPDRLAAEVHELFRPSG